MNESSSVENIIASVSSSSSVVDNQMTSSGDEKSWKGHVSTALDHSLQENTALPCEMCSNYEIKLQQLQDVERALKQQLGASQHLADRYQTELSGERLYRSELEQRMIRLSGETEHEFKSTSDRLSFVDDKLSNALIDFDRRQIEHGMEIDHLRAHILSMEKKMADLRLKYDNLRGAHRQSAQEMQAEEIALPDSISDLQFLCLQLREQLIESRAAKQHETASLQDELQIAVDHARRMEAHATASQMQLTESIDGARTELGIANSKLNGLHEAESRAERSEQRMMEMKLSMEQLENRVDDLQKEKSKLECSSLELRQRITVLQQELDTSETVQKDFVKLSQSLQIQLEKIRQAEQEVRWQFEDDVYLCNSCEQPFTRQRTRQHCLHCGRIFCSTCLPNSVPSGPQRRPAKVCQLCHTLLCRHSAPYFSHTTPE